MVWVVSSLAADHPMTSEKSFMQTSVDLERLRALAGFVAFAEEALASQLSDQHIDGRCRQNLTTRKQEKQERERGRYRS